MKIVGDSFLFQFKDTLGNQIIEYQKKLPTNAPRLDLEAPNHDGVVSLHIPLPVITLPNISHKKLDWKVLGDCAKKLETILSYVNEPLMRKEVPHDLFLSEDHQLMAIETFYSGKQEFHGCPLNVGFSSAIAEKLALEYQDGTRIPDCEKVAFDFFLRLSTSTSRDRESTRKLFGFRINFTSLNVSVREGGVPHFVVPGNCACLGANPDEFKYDRDMYSHNLDTALQQITMLVSLCCFWNNVLKPLSKKK